MSSTAAPVSAAPLAERLLRMVRDLVAASRARRALRLAAGTLVVMGA